MNSKRKMPNDWQETGHNHSAKCPKTTFEDDNDMDDLLAGLEFEDFSSGFEDGATSSSSTNGSERDDILDLTTWKRCVVESVERDKKTFDLILSGCQDNTEKNERKMVCRLQGAWCHTRVQKNDIVSVQAVWSESIRSFCVSNEAGLVVVQPDFLVSGTSVVGGLFCQRRAVLSDRFRGIDSGSKIMTIGSIVHELLQIVLRRRLSSLEAIRKVCEEVLRTPQMSFTLYDCGMTAEEIRGEIEKFIEKIHDFVQRYVVGTLKNQKVDKDSFTGTIDSIQDIEENIWIPQLGLKGKVDVSVNIRRSKGDNLKYMPLELKTGRASFSSEHRGQLILYQMMMSALGAKVDSGLLLYLREGVFREVSGSRNDQRDLILLRNELAYFLSKSSIDAKEPPKTLEEFNQMLTHTELPPPINHHSACGSCPYNALCSIYLKRDEEMMASLSNGHPLREIASVVTVFLTEAHVQYFCHWIGLLTLEEKECRKSIKLKNLWTESPETRQRNGYAIINLELQPNVVVNDDINSNLHEFHLKQGSNVGDLTIRGINVGDYLVVSTMNRLAVAAGRVCKLEAHSITMSLERDLSTRYLRQSFILDRYESQSMMTFNMANISALLNDTDASERLRKIIVDKIPPTFSKQLPKIIATEGKKILCNLNPIQRTAVLKALTVNEYLLLKGLPGTGKTQTLTAIIQLLVMMGKSVIITSHTHSAVDNLLLRLHSVAPEVKFMRLGSGARIHPQIKSHSEHTLTQNCFDPESLKQIYERYNVIGVTCLGASHPLLIQKKFDVCLVDESTQVLQTTIIRPLLSAAKFILVGDPDQLPPIVRSLEARKLGADESLFVRLDSEQATVALTLQYRMNRTITKVANNLTYKGLLKCGNDTVAGATIELSKSDSKTERWIERTISSHIDQAVCVLNTGAVHERCVEFMKGLEDQPLIPKGDVEETKSPRIYTNYCEAAIILNVIRVLKERGMENASIGVMAPYVLQVELLRKLIWQSDEADDRIEVNTVDQYQGRDKDVIIYSCSRMSQKEGESTTRSASRTEILEDQRRLTVAITRSKHKLILIGDAKMLENYTPFKRLLDSVPRMAKIDLVEEHHDFVWANTMRILNGIVN